MDNAKPATPAPLKAIVKSRAALWTVQYSGAKTERMSQHSGVKTVVAFTLEEAVMKLRLSDTAYQECRVTSVTKGPDIDLGLPDKLLRKEI